MQHVDWLDRTLYPFASHYLELDAGRMHYVDEGEGPVILMVHGTPTWSFLYRHLIRQLRREHRCIAMDHLGFGLSDKPPHWSYRPEDHARNLSALIAHLGLQRFTLAVHDFGGPIGLSYAIDHPEQIERLVLFNTWLWSLQDDEKIRRVARLMGGPIGKLLYLHANVSTRFLVRAAWGEKPTLSQAVHRHYINAVPRPRDRIGMWILARELVGSSQWHDGLWERSERIKDLPTLLLWGMRDPTFNSRFLTRWQALFTDQRTLTYPQAGHFIPDEAGEAAAQAIEEFMSGARLIAGRSGNS